jgi:S1-C subfamily serine protease
MHALLAAVVALAAPGPLPRAGVARALGYTVTLEGGGLYGAGVLVAPERGLVLTSAHVIADGAPPRATFFDGAEAPTRVLQIDRALDLALLAVPPQPRRAPPPLDAAPLAAGDEVYAVGNPHRLGFSVCRGIVSYVGRSLGGGRYLQTDLPIHDGDSGGPVVNARGELVGIVSFVLARTGGLAFALPVDAALARFGLTPPARP